MSLARGALPPPNKMFLNFCDSGREVSVRQKVSVDSDQCGSAAAAVSAARSFLSSNNSRAI